VELPGVTALGEQWAEQLLGTSTLAALRERMAIDVEAFTLPVAGWSDQLVQSDVLEAHARLVETAATFTTAALHERVAVPEPDLKLDRADLGLTDLDLELDRAAIDLELATDLDRVLREIEALAAAHELHHAEVGPAHIDPAVTPDQQRLLEVMYDAAAALASAIIGAIHLGETQLLGESIGWAIAVFGVCWTVSGRGRRT